MSATIETAPPLFSAACIDNPYPTCRHHLRGPALQLLDEERNIWGVFRYAQCTALFRSPHLSSVRPPEALVRTAPENMAEFRDLIDHMNGWLLLRDPPSHPLLRKSMNRGFSPTVVEGLRPTVELTVTRILNSMQEGREIDVIRDIAYPLPVMVISRLLGIPEALDDRCVALTNELAIWFGSMLRTPETARVAQSNVHDLTAIFQQVIDERRSSAPRTTPDLLDLLLVLSASDQGMSEQELYSQCVMLLFAGHETTRHWIGNTIHTLLEHPESLSELRSDPALVRGATEEVLRFESPVKMLARAVTSDIAVDGVTVPKGHLLVFVLAAANRDPAQFADPERFDPHRTHNRHLAFGGDAHVCLGNTLARLEGQIAVSALFNRFPNLRRARPGADWAPSVGFRGLKTLPVIL